MFTLAATHYFWKNDLRHDLWIAFVGGVFATAAWVFVAYLFHRGRMWVAFHGLKGTYDERKKFTNGVTGKRLEINVKRSQLHVRFIDGLRKGETVAGQIAMDERTRNTGRGQYEHIVPPIRTRPHSQQLFGFWEIQLKASAKPTTILVHTTYSNEQEVATFQGYEWTKVAD